MTMRPRMMPGELREAVRGVLAFPVTPYAADGAVDLDAVRDNVEWLPDTGIAAVVAPSGTGEFFSLTPDECLAIATATVEAVRQRVPVIGGVGVNIHTAIPLARSMEAAGVDGIMVLPPYYAKPDPKALTEYYRAIAAAVSIGVLVYSRDAAIFSPDMVVELAATVPNFIGFKDGRGDVRLFQRIRRAVIQAFGAERIAFLAGVGDDMVAPYFAAGAEGFTSSIACFWPEMAVELYQLARAGAYEQLDEVYRRAISPIYEMRQRGAGFEVSVNKEILNILGHKAGRVRPPLANLQLSDIEEARAMVRTLDIPSAAVRRAAAVHLRQNV